MEENFAWIYLLFFLIPLARIVPRLLKRRKQKQESAQTHQDQFFGEFGKTIQEQPSESASPKTNDMLVLGELVKGPKKFENLQKITKLDSGELNSILEDLENRGLMTVQHKSGFFGPVVELHVTDKGIKELE